MKSKGVFIALSVFSLLIVVVFIFMINAVDKKLSADKLNRINHYKIGGQDFYIPQKYLNFSYTSAGGDSALIQMWYPGDMPVPGSSKELFQSGEWYKNVRLLFTFPPKPNPAGSVQHSLKFNKADRKVGVEHGLVHYTQSNDHDRIFRRDVWVEEDEQGSQIECSKKTDEDDPVQLCSHYFYKNDVHFKVTYDQRLFPDWKHIKESVVELYDSFGSYKAAELYQQKIMNTDYKGE